MTQLNNKAKIKKRVLTAISIVIIAVLSYAIISVAISVSRGKTPSVFGYSFLHVVTDSMETQIPVNTVIFVKMLNENQVENLQVGEIITFKAVIGGYNTTKTHRIIEIDKTEKKITTEGDNASGPDKPITYDMVVAKYICNVGFITWLYKVLSSFWGFLLIIILPCLALLISYIYTIAKQGVLMKNKRLANEEQAKLEEKIRKEILESVEAKKDNSNEESNE